MISHLLYLVNKCSFLDAKELARLPIVQRTLLHLKKKCDKDKYFYLIKAIL